MLISWTKHILNTGHWLTVVLAAPALTLGALALVSPLLGSSPDGHRNPKIEEIVSRISAENLQHHVEKLAAINSRHVASDTIAQAWQYIESEFKKNPRLQVELDEFDQPLRRLGGKTVHMVNVVAVLPGTTDPDRYYLVSGHYDSRATDIRDAQSRAPGAVDDGSGTASVLELARVLSQYKFDASLVFVAFTGEEEGLIGSQHWAEKAKAAGMNIDGVLNNDIVGNIEGGGGLVSNTRMRVFSEGVPASETEMQARIRQAIGGEVDSPARQLARYVKRIGEAYLPGFHVEMIYRRDRFGRGGDHTSFSRVGYPAVRLTDLYENYRHQHQNVRVEDGVQYGDLPQFYNAPFAAKICRVNAAVLASLADAPAPPKEVTVSGAVGYDTSLHWNAAEAADLAGYRILMRKTTAPTWQRAIDIGKVTEFTLKGIIVDNFFFAVQSLDQEGNASRAVFPGVRRRR